jgi:hypothetical protein
MAVVVINIIIVLPLGTTLNNTDYGYSGIFNNYQMPRNPGAALTRPKNQNKACTRRSCVRNSLALGIANKHFIGLLLFKEFSINLSPKKFLKSKYIEI